MAIYLEENDLLIRSMKQADVEALFAAFSQQGWDKPIEILRNYYIQQENGERKVVVAEVNGHVAGYVTLLPEAKAGPFAFKNVPEIVDFNVFIEYRKRGIGNKILDITEQLARESCCSVCLAVGLYSDYGNAQRIYVKRGYIPDGTGVWYNDKQLEPYAPCRNDDSLLLYMKKDF